MATEEGNKTMRVWWKQRSKFGRKSEKRAKKSLETTDVFTTIQLFVELMLDHKVCSSKHWSVIDKQATEEQLPHYRLSSARFGLSHRCSCGSGQFHAKLQETMANRRQLMGKKNQVKWAETVRVAFSLSHILIVCRCSLTLQGVFHVLSEQHPHDLSADFAHVEFLRKPENAKSQGSEYWIFCILFVS